LSIGLQSQCIDVVPRGHVVRHTQRDIPDRARLRISERLIHRTIWIVTKEQCRAIVGGSGEQLSVWLGGHDAESGDRVLWKHGCVEGQFRCTVGRELTNNSLAAVSNAAIG